jgi:NAD(P)H-hydrate epimerase
MIRLTRAQVREIDRRAIEEYGIPGIVLMENAARAVVDVAMEMIDGIADPSVVIVCGGGNNGGDGLAVARHLHNRGVDVIVAHALDPAKLTGDAAINWKIVDSMRLFRLPADDSDVSLHMTSSSLVIDALFGTGLTAAPRDPFPIDLMNAGGTRVLSIDLPSGMNCDTGEVMGTCVRATRTVTFVAEKNGFANPASRQFTGEITVGCIGCPRELIDEVAKMSSP